MNQAGSRRSSYDELLALVKGLSAQVEALTSRVVVLEAENVKLRLENDAFRVENAGLRADNAALRVESAALKRKLGVDSTNSSAPPSQDSLGSKEKRRSQRSQRVRSKDRKPGWAAGAHRVGFSSSGEARSDRDGACPGWLFRLWR